MSSPLIWQYRGKPKARATIEALGNESSTCFKSALAVANLLSIEDATGYALDLVGRHVGQSREMPNYVPRSYFGFTNNPDSRGFGVGEFYRMGNATRDKTLLNDDDFRFMIKARVMKNYQMADVGDLDDSVKFLLGSGAGIIDNYNMTMNVIVPESALNTFTQYAIINFDILRRPIGVKYTFLVVFNPEQYFGFSRDKKAKGFGVGKFARLLEMSPK